MIKIAVRENGIFTPGYPYNATIDGYFKILSPEFINNYGLHPTDVAHINKHKNDTLLLDTDIHTFITKLSTFIIGFDTVGKGIIEEYEIIKKNIHELKVHYTLLETKKNSTTEEFTFITANIEQLKEDLSKIIELFDYYNKQLVNNTLHYGVNYVTETQEEIKVINSNLSSIDNDFAYYLSALEVQIGIMVTVKKQIMDYRFQAINLRSMYEEWQKRPEAYFIKLVDYFKAEYDVNWTYGTSLMFGEKLETENVEYKLYRQIADKWQDILFKKHNFNIDKAVKEYSITWLTSRTEVNEEEFIFNVECKRVEILRLEIINIERLIDIKTTALHNIIPVNKDNNYSKYKEIIFEKMQYIISNINGTVDSEVLKSYDVQLDTLITDYNYVTSRLSQPIYWLQFADKEMHSELLISLRTQLETSGYIIEKGFKPTEYIDASTQGKLDYYKTEKTVTNTKIDELTLIKSKLELDNNAYQDEISLISSKLNEQQTLLTTKINEYLIFFESRLPFFTQYVEPNYDNIIELLRGNFFKSLDDRYNSFANYNSPIKWYIEEDRNNLNTLYSTLLGVIKTNLSQSWHIEFDHEITNTKKMAIYAYYIDIETKLLYATVNKHLLASIYDADYIEKLKKMYDDIKNIFITYVDIAFSIGHNISILTNIFDYSEIYEFDIQNNKSTKENVKTTFFTILDNILIFANNKNMEFKVLKNLVDNQQKISRVWLDMEKKYV